MRARLRQAFSDFAGPTGAARPPTWADRLAALGGAAGWLAVLVVRLAGTPEAFWRYRDDAVITLSHARGLAEFGSVSVSAIPERIEGFSAPLQFALAVPYYLAGFDRWEPFLDAQVAIGALLCGYFCARLVASTTGASRAVTVVASVAAAALAFVPYTTVGWFASGMENSVTAPLLLASAYALVGLHRRVVHPAWVGLALALLGLARVELFILVLPLVLLAVAIALPVGGRRAATMAAGIPLVAWALVHGLRLAYFGSLVPNSGVAQNKDPAASIGPWLLLAFLIAVSLVAVVWIGPRLVEGREAKLRRPLMMLLVGLAMALPLAVVMTLAPTDSMPLVVNSFTSTPRWLAGLIAISLLAWLLGARLGRVETTVLVVATSLPLAQLAVFDAARLDPFRISSMMQIPLATLVVAQLVVLAMVLVRNHEGVMTRPVVRFTVLGAALVAPFVLAATAAELPGVREIARGEDLCCDISPLDQQILEASERFADDTDVPIPLVASPDLGKLSHAKATGVIDLGRLGSPFLTLVEREIPERRDELLLDVLGPDLLAVQGGWNCVYGALLTSPGFTARYLVGAADAESLFGGEGCPEEGRFTIFERRSTDPAATEEWGLSRELIESNRPGELVRSAIHRCAASSTDRWRCQPVRRSVERALPFLDTDDLDAIHPEFARSPTARLDEILLFERDTAGWAKRATEAFRQIDDGPPSR